MNRNLIINEIALEADRMGYLYVKISESNGHEWNV